MRKLSELRIGDAIHDMHDGFPAWKRLDLDVDVESVKSIRTPMPQSAEVVNSMLAGYGRYYYTNKTLVLVGTDHRGRYTFAYSYDDRELGVIQVERLGVS